MKTILLIILTALCLQTHAESLLYYAPLQDRESYIDTDSIRLINKGQSGVLVRVKWVNQKPENDGASYIYREYLIDCEKNIIKAIDWKSYTHDGIRVGSTTYREIDEAIDEYQTGTHNEKMINIDTLVTKNNSACIEMQRWIRDNPNIETIQREQKTRGKKYIPLRHTGGVYYLTAEVNSMISEEFIVDTGATDVTISRSLYQNLLELGTISKKDIQGFGYYRIANGTTQRTLIIMLTSLKVGSTTIKNVKASVANSDNAPLLFGQSALKKLGAWRINALSGKLEIDAK